MPKCNHVCDLGSYFPASSDTHLRISVKVRTRAELVQVDCSNRSFTSYLKAFFRSKFRTFRGLKGFKPLKGLSTLGLKEVIYHLNLA